MNSHESASLRSNVANERDAAEPFRGVGRVTDQDEFRGHGAKRPRDTIDDANTADGLQSFRHAAKPRRASAGENGADQSRSPRPSAAASRPAVSARSTSGS